MHKYQGTEVSAVKAALRKRDMDISELQERISGLEQTVMHNSSIELAETLHRLQGELSRAGSLLITGDCFQEDIVDCVNCDKDTRRA